MTKHSDSKSSRPLPLGKRVSRIAESLVEGSLSPAPPISGEVLAEVVSTRRLRYRYFPAELFGEPAWDMLLELMHAQVEGRQVTVTNLCEAAGVPGTVALRWLSSLVDEGLVQRRSHPKDSTSEIIELEPKTSALFRRYFHDVTRPD